jgi:hypothetical protein
VRVNENSGRISESFESSERLVKSARSSEGQFEVSKKKKKNPKIDQKRDDTINT